jgi:MinD superfamily P-loop ATPase
MAEYCRECAERCLGFNPEELKHAVWSKEPDLCEGCGEYTSVLVRLPAKKLVTNVIKHPYKFRVTFRGGNTDTITVHAESLDAAALLLPTNVAEYKCEQK